MPERTKGRVEEGVTLFLMLDAIVQEKKPSQFGIKAWRKRNQHRISVRSSHIITLTSWQGISARGCSAERNTIPLSRSQTT